MKIYFLTITVEQLQIFILRCIFTDMRNLKSYDQKSYAPPDRHSSESKVDIKIQYSNNQV